MYIMFKLIDKFQRYQRKRGTRCTCAHNHRCLSLNLILTELVLLHQFETHINGFLEPESLNFDPNHPFLSSLEAEIITFLPEKAAI